MKRMYLLLYILGGMLLLPLHAYALSISPATIQLKDLANGLTISKTFNLSRANPATNEVFDVSIEGDGARYIVLPSATLEAPKGKEEVSYTFTIKPEHAPNGAFKALLSFVGRPLTKAGSAKAGAPGMQIVTAVTGTIKFSITDQQVEAFQIVDVIPQDTEERKPFTMDIILRNTGNVDARPDAIEVSLVDETDAAHRIIETIPESSLAFVAPTKEERFTATLQTLATQGRYRGKVVVMSEGKNIFEKEITVIAHPEGTLAQDATLENFTVDRSKVEKGDLVKFDIAVKNRGEVTIEPSVFLEIKQGEKTIDLLRADKKAISKRQDGLFTLTFRFQDSGNYTVSAYAEYGSKRTEAKFLTVEVGSSWNAWVWSSIIGSAILGIVGFLLWWWRKRIIA